MLTYCILIILLPLIGFIISGLFGNILGIKGTIFLNISCSFLACLLSIILFILHSFIFPIGIFLTSDLYSWVNFNLLDIKWHFIFDSVSILMLFIITLISFLVHVYSVSYMDKDPHIQRFLSYLSLFTFFMIILVTSGNFLQLFVGWEGVGLCSYLLINFWYGRIQANKAAIKAMIINRCGDFSLILGIILIFLTFKSLNFSTVFSLVPLYTHFSISFYFFSINLVELIGFFLFVGAMGKSAQLGLHVWLPDAMEGPTPVSALIHAATMVTAGVFLIVRCSPLFEYTPTVLIFITIVGALTSIIFATIGLVQNDIKKIIAYSTCSQLGYMMFICGMSNYSASMYHLANHAFFKALLFLGAGAIIHALQDEQDIRKFGGLVQLLPFSYSMMFIGSLSLMGFPYLSGFYSKDLILELAYSNYTFVGHFTYWVGTCATFFTAFYSIRLLYLTFLSEPNGYKYSLENIHDAPFLMSVPLIILAIGSIFFGYLTKDLLVGLGTPYWNNSIYMHPSNLLLIKAEFLPVYIKNLPTIFSLLGFLVSFLSYRYCFKYLYKVKILLFKPIYIFFNKKWFIDKIYNNLITQPVLVKSYSSSYKFLDKGLFELLGPYGLSYYLYMYSKNITKLNTGFLYHYALSMLFGIILLVTLVTLIQNA